MKELKSNIMATTLLLLFLSLEIGVAVIVTKPIDTEVLKGGSTYFNCSTNSPHEIHWFHTSTESKQGRSFVYGYDQFYQSYKERFQLEKNEANGAFNLIIQSVKSEDAGIYECQDEIGRGDKATAQLIVLDADPVCGPSSETLEIIGENSCGIKPGQLILSCTVTFHGNEAPIMAWRKAGDPKPVSNGVTHQRIGDNRTVYNLTITGNSTTQDGASYFCNTTRSTTLNNSCKTGTIKVQGTAETHCASDVDCNCPSCTPAIAWLIILLLLIVIVVAVGLTLRIRDDWRNKITGFFRPKKQKQKHENEPEYEAKNQETVVPTNVQTNEEHQKLESDVEAANAQSRPLLANESEADDEKTELNCDDSSKDETEQFMGKTNYTTRNISELEKLRAEKDARIKALETKLESEADKTKKQSDEIKKLKEEARASETEISELKANVKELEQILYPPGNIEYAEKPTLVHMIVTDAETKERRRPINGMTILGHELFVSHEKCSVISVYDSDTFQFGRNWEIEGMSDPLDIASCKKINCLFIVFRKHDESESHISKLDPKGGSQMAKWSTGGALGRLSTYESNVILCLSDKQLIHEYSKDGQLLRTVRLSPAVGFTQPWHAIKVTNSQFAVCHGETKNERRRVCIVDDQGNIIKELRKWNHKTTHAKIKFGVPICLVEDSKRSILVADRDNQKIQLLDCFLKHQSSLIKKEIGLDGYPVRICLDETKGRLFVAENSLSSNKKERKGGRILIFNIK